MTRGEGGTVGQTAGPQDSRTGRQPEAGRQSARRLVVAAAVGIGEGAIKRVTRASRLKS